MSEPRRWKDSPSAPVGVRELLGSAKPTRPLDEQAFRRGEGRIAKLSMAPAAVAVSIWSKLAAAGAIGLAAAGAAVVVEGRMDPATAPHVVVAPPVAVPAATGAAPSVPVVPIDAPPPAPVVSSEKAPAPVVPSETAPALVAVPKLAARSGVTAHVEASSAAPVPVWVPAEPERAKSSLPEELALLEAARSHMTRSPETALARLAEHRARHPAGVLAVERDLMELDALRRTGRVQDARDRATAWLAREPNGLHSARVRAIAIARE